MTKLKNPKSSGFRISELEFESQSGQSLIETIMAIFILTTGLSSGLALAVFSFGAASDISEKIVATGLAREGVEGVRRRRDSNWIAGSLGSCSGLGTGQQCYSTWLTQSYNITGSTGGIAERLVFNPTTNGPKWNLDFGTDYRLYQQLDGGLNHSSAGTQTHFFRKITLIYYSTSFPYDATSPLVLVRSAVWWHGKRCAAITDLTDPSQTNCKIITEEYLTNWRTY